MQTPKDVTEDIKKKKDTVHSEKEKKVDKEQKIKRQATFAFHHWVAFMQAQRANALLKEKQSFGFREKSIVNFKALLTRLRNLEGPYSEEMKRLIERKRTSQDMQYSGDKKSSGDNKVHNEKRNIPALTPEEKDLMRRLLEGEWKIRHATWDYKIIKEKGNILLSLEERKRRKEEIENSHTATAEGNTDNVFFTFGPGEIESPKFLDGAEAVISVDYKKLMYRTGRFSDNPHQHSLTGMWSSDHIYAYRTQQNSSPVNLYGTILNVFYRKEVDKNDNIEFVKYCSFLHPDGQTYVQSIRMGEEIYAHPRMDIALLLMTIEKIRHLGADAWQQIMKEKNLVALQCLVQTLFHPGVFEIHKPAMFKIEQPGVEVISRNVTSVEKPKSYSKILDKMVADEANNRRIILAAIKKENGIVINALDKHEITPLSKIRNLGSNIMEISLLAAVLLSRNIELINELLSRGFEIENNEKILTAYVNASYCTFSLIDCVFLLSNLSSMQTMVKDVPELQVRDLKQDSESIERMLALFLKEGVSRKHNRNIRSMFQIDIYKLQSYFQECRRGVYPLSTLKSALALTQSAEFDLFSFIHAVLLDSSQKETFEIIDLLIKRKVDINKGMNLSFNIPTVKGKPLMRGCTPLMAAVLNQDSRMVRYLLTKGLDINAGLKTIPRNAKAYRVHEWEGYTATMIAIESGAEEVLDELLKYHPDLGIKACSGLTVSALVLAKGGKCYQKVKPYLLGLEENVKDFKAKQEVEHKIGQENIQLFDERTFVILKGKDKKGEVQFALFRNDSSSIFSRQLQLLNFPLNEFLGKSKEQYPASLKKMIHFPTARWQNLGGWSIEVPFFNNNTHYRLEFMLCELGNQSNASLSIENYKYSVSESELLKLNSDMTAQIDNEKITPFTVKILSALLKMNEMRPWTEAELKCLKDDFNQTLLTGYELTKAVVNGDIKAASVLTKKLHYVDFTVPVSDDFIKTHYSLNTNETFCPDEGVFSLSPVTHAVLKRDWPMSLLLINQFRKSGISAYLSDSGMKDIVKADQGELFFKLLNLGSGIVDTVYLKLAVIHSSHEVLKVIAKKQDNVSSIFDLAIEHFSVPVIQSSVQHLSKAEKVKGLDRLFWNYYYFCSPHQDSSSPDFCKITKKLDDNIILSKTEVDNRVLKIMEILDSALSECRLDEALRTALASRNIILFKKIIALFDWKNTEKDPQQIINYFYGFDRLFKNDIVFFEDVLKTLLTVDAEWSPFIPIVDYYSQGIGRPFTEFFLPFYAKHSPKAYSLMRGIRDNFPALVEVLTRNAPSIDNFIILIPRAEYHTEKMVAMRLIDYALDCLFKNRDYLDCVLMLLQRGSNPKNLTSDQSRGILSSNDEKLIRYFVRVKEPRILDILSSLELVYNTQKKLNLEEVEFLKFLVQSGAKPNTLWCHVMKTWDIDLLQWLIAQNSSWLDELMISYVSKYSLMKESMWTSATFIMTTLNEFVSDAKRRSEMIDCIRLAVLEGADLNVKDEQGHTAWDYLKALKAFGKKGEALHAEVGRDSCESSADEKRSKDVPAEIKQLMDQIAEIENIFERRPVWGRSSIAHVHAHDHEPMEQHCMLAQFAMRLEVQSAERDGRSTTSFSL